MIKINHQINEEGINNPVFFETQTYSNFHPLIRARLIFQLRGPSNSAPRGRKKKTKPLEPPSLSPIDQFSLQQTSPLGFASISRQLNARRPNEAQAKRIPRSTL